MTRTGRPRSAERVTIACWYCGKEWERPAWDAKKFCDREHWRLWKAENRKRRPEPEKPEAPRQCAVEGCGRPHKGHGYCDTHLKRFHRTGSPTGSAPMGRRPTPVEKKLRCSVVDCGDFAIARGLCRKHYIRWYRRGGDPGEALTRGRHITPVSQRGQYAVDEETGCWNWTAYVSPYGYGVVGVGSKNYQAHRAMYEELVGPIPEGLTLDHLCGNEQCVNPDHLDPCTAAENLFRGGRPHFDLRGHGA